MPPERKRREHIAMADCVFPNDIMICILTRVPVKSILRFKSVCKPWCKLFSTREFMKMHQGQFSSDPRNQSVIIQTRNYNEYGGPMSLWNIGSDEKKPSILDDPHPETQFMDIVGCCNGLVCMGRHELGPDDIILWNPATKLFKFVKFSGNVDSRIEFDNNIVSLGFGYDADGDDFKVVKNACFSKNSVDISVWVEVYSVNSDSWTKVEPDFLFCLQHQQILAFVNGNPYWQATVDEDTRGKSRNIGDVLLWLDLRKLVFKTVPYVTHNFHVGEMASVLFDWKGSLGAISYNTVNEGFEYRNIWVFDDGEQIWRKDYTFGPIRPIEVKLGQILQCSKNGGKMLCSMSDKMSVFDLETGWVKVYEAQPPPYPFNIYSCLYAESLTYIKGMRPLEMNKEDEDDPWWGF